MNKKKFYLFPLLVVLLFCACQKTDVTFQDDGNTTDPNIIYLEDYKVDIATYKLDSFVTSGHGTFMLGTHTDTSFGKISSDSYTEIQIPASNPVLGKDVTFDSLVLVLKPTGAYYGDTVNPLKLAVHQVYEPIENEDTTDNNFYYPRHMTYGFRPIGSTITTVKPNKTKEISIRLSDGIGDDWLFNLKRGNDEIKSQDKFRDYFNGLCILSDTVFNKTVFYFNAGDSNVFIKLYYKERGITLTEKVIVFGYRNEKQFNNISYNFTNTPFAIFPKYKKQVKPSSAMNKKAYVSNNIPCFTKITFSNLLALKELHPYVKILKAELEIKPAPGTFSYPYSIPSTLQMYTSNSDNNLDGVLMDETGQSQQTGNLYIDELYGEKTNYSFNITNFVNEILAEGRFSSKALFLSTTKQNGDTETSRLVINEQGTANGIKLKLYVLGL